MRHLFIPVLLLCSSLLHAAPGDLDTSFGGGKGWVSTGFQGLTYAYGRDMIQQADGKLVVVGFGWNGSYDDVALLRYNTNGSLDTTFDGDGKLTTAISVYGDGARSVIQQADGKLVVAGYSQPSGNYSDFALARYNANGSLDSTFDGDGKLTTAVSAYGDVAHSVIQQADGKLVVTGFSSNGSNVDVALLRYNADGSLDTTFSGDGKLTTAISAGSNDEVWSVIQQANGKLVVAGHSSNGSNSDVALLRYNANGSLDTTFSGDGKLTTAIGTGNDQAYALIQQADGKLVAAGYSHNGSDDDFALLRYNSDGSLDTTFDGDGKLIAAIGTGNDYGQSVIQQADGKLVMAGYSHNGSDHDFALMRYNANGTLDTTFSGDGKLTTAIGTGNDCGQSVIQQTDGRLAVSGYAYNGSNYDFVVARYESGQLDTDSDSLVDWLDTDNDGDGVPNGSDAFPLDATESIDNDGDGTGNNADPDDDNDGLPDVMDPLPFQAVFNLNSSYQGSSIREATVVQ